MSDTELAIKWRTIAERRYRVSTTYIVGFSLFVVGMLVGMVTKR